MAGPVRKRLLRYAFVILFCVVLVAGAVCLIQWAFPPTPAETLVAELRDACRPPGFIERWLVKCRLMKEKKRRDPWAISGDLAELGPPAVPALFQALKDEDGVVRWYAAEALGRIGPGAKDAVPALTQALKDIGGPVRKYAAEALGKIGPGTKDAVPALTELLKDKEDYVRDAAKEALERIQPHNYVSKPNSQNHTDSIARLRHFSEERAG